MALEGNLRLDRILTSQPELGPSIPDGGYGWVVLVCSMFVQALVPSVLAMYGVMALFFWSEQGVGEWPRLSDMPILQSAVVFAAAWWLTAPTTRSFVSSSSWPRLVAVSGVCLLCAGILLQWIALANSIGPYLYILSGMISGVGCSLVMSQSEHLVGQYFRRRLPLARNLGKCAQAFGFIATPIGLGILVPHHGMLRSLLIHQAALLQLLIIVLPYRKPDYLKARRRRYQLIGDIASHDEDTVYPATELTDVSSPASPSAKQPDLLRQSFAEEVENVPQSSPQPNSLYSELRATDTYFAEQQPSSQPIPIIYSEVRSTDTVVPEPQQQSPGRNRQWVSACLSFLSSGQFYRELAVSLAVRVSELTFWMTFPTQLYMHTKDGLHVRQAAVLAGCSALGGLLGATAVTVLPQRHRVSRVVETLVQATGGLACLLMSAPHRVEPEGWLLANALLLTMVHRLAVSLAPQQQWRTPVDMLVGMLLLTPLAANPTFTRSLGVAAIMHFIASLLLLLHHLLEAMKRRFSQRSHSSDTST